jgi:hypothetical protein
MTGRGRPDAQAGESLPFFDRHSPPPPGPAVAARIDAQTGPGDVVADPLGRGGWIARSAIDRQRRAVSLETDPLTRTLAEVVLRPPDVRHLDAAFQGMAASPRRESSLKTSIGDLFATRCATCGRVLVVDEVAWLLDDDASIAGRTRPVERHYRCTVCRDQLGGSEHRLAPLDQDDLRRATADVGAAEMRAGLISRFPVIDGAEDLPREFLDLHTDRQLVGLGAILERIEGDLRAAPVTAALRLALLHAILPASRLGNGPGRHSALRVSSGHIRPTAGTRVRERNPWLAFEEGFRLVRGFVQRLDPGPHGPVQARLGADLRSLGEGAATTFIGLTGAAAAAGLRDDPDAYGRTAATPRIHLAIGQAPMRPSLDRLAVAYQATAWILGSEAAGTLNLGPLAGTSIRRPWATQVEPIAEALSGLGPAMARTGRVVLFVDGGESAVMATVLGAARAGFRLLSAELAEPDDGRPSVVELLPPGGRLPPGPRTRANVDLAALPGLAGDPAVVSSARVFAPPEPIDHDGFSAAEAARVVTETAVETLSARGEPARRERLIGEILVGLDRAGQIHRLIVGSTPPPPTTDGDRPMADAGPDSVERLTSVIRDELERPGQGRLTELEPGCWWLTDPDDLADVAVPLSDRVEWAAFSLLSTAGPLSEGSSVERIRSMFRGSDRADDELIRACLESYRSPTSPPDRSTTDDDLLERSHEHTAILENIADSGHRLGMRVWLGRRQQTRRVGGHLLGDLLDDSERRLYLGNVGPPADVLAEVDAVWYVRGKAIFLFEVEWTAMLGEVLLRRHARIPPDPSVIRFLVIAPERAELVRFKIARSPLLQSALASGTWHIMTSERLRAFLARDPLDLADLEPYLGLESADGPAARQMPLFAETGGGPTLPAADDDRARPSEERP